MTFLSLIMMGVSGVLYFLPSLISSVGHGYVYFFYSLIEMEVWKYLHDNHHTDTAPKFFFVALLVNNHDTVIEKSEQSRMSVCCRCWTVKHVIL